MNHDEIKAALDLLQGSDIPKGAAAVRSLIYESREGDSVYHHYPELLRLLSSQNETARTRAILLLAHNARWDRNGLLDNAMDEYLSHLYDEEGETAEHLIRSLVWIAREKPYLKDRFISALKNYEIDRISEANRDMIKANLQDSLSQLEKINT